MFEEGRLEIAVIDHMRAKTAPLLLSILSEAPEGRALCELQKRRSGIVAGLLCTLVHFRTAVRDVSPV